MNKHEQYGNKKPNHAQSLNAKQAEDVIEVQKPIVGGHTANVVTKQIEKGFNNGRE